MTVEELITKLKEFEPSDEVVLAPNNYHCLLKRMDSATWIPETTPPFIGQIVTRDDFLSPLDLNKLRSDHSGARNVVVLWPI